MRIPLTFLTLVLLTSCGGTGTRTPDTDHASHSPSTNTSASSSPVDHNAMDHSSLRSSPGAASAPRELQFLDTMIVHHQAAVDMAMLAETRAQRAELKELAANIIGDQERSIAKMSGWREQWFEGKPEAVNMDFAAMAGGMRGIDSKKLESVAGSEFDVEFIRQMISHYQGAVEMARAIKGRDGRPELNELADDIITAYEAEIKQMREWLKAWQSQDPNQNPKSKIQNLKSTGLAISN